MDTATGYVEENSIVFELLKDSDKLLNKVKNEIVKKINSTVSKDPIKSDLNAWVGVAFK